MSEIAWLGLCLLCFLLGAGFGWWRGYRCGRETGKERGINLGYDVGYADARFWAGKNVSGFTDQRARESGAA